MSFVEPMELMTKVRERNRLAIPRCGTKRLARTASSASTTISLDTSPNSLFECDQQHLFQWRPISCHCCLRRFWIESSPSSSTKSQPLPAAASYPPPSKTSPRRISSHESSSHAHADPVFRKHITNLVYDASWYDAGVVGDFPHYVLKCMDFPLGPERDSCYDIRESMNASRLSEIQSVVQREKQNLEDAEPSKSSHSTNNML
jgi:hypothetical protein